MALKLKLNSSPNVPIEVEGVTPDRLRNLSRSEIERRDVFHGNQKLQLGELFDVSGSLDDATIVWEGDLSRVHWIGAKMTDGSILVDGDCGRHLGSEMRGGQITVAHNAGDWVGAEMHGGLISVGGNAGHLIGAAYRGSSVGMTGGTVLIRGNAGNEIGHTLRRGLIAIGGSCGDLAGFNMLAGSVLVLGDCGIRHGAGMRRGTLGLLGAEPPSLLLSFRRACRCRPDVMQLIFRYLQRHEFPVDDELAHSDLEMYCGDMIEGGRGEVLTRCR